MAYLIIFAFLPLVSELSKIKDEASTLDVPTV
jgi:hypothetical protein